jgi:Cellulose biosynthesis protein BcsS
MAAVNGAITSIGPTGYVRAAFGFKVLAPAFIGPETEALWCGDFQELEFGAHITGWHTERFEWSAGGGWALTTDHRDGPYLRLGVNARF